MSVSNNAILDFLRELHLYPAEDDELLRNANTLNEISEIGKSYIAGDRARAVTFVNLLVKEGKIKTIEDLLNLSKLFSEKDRKLVVDSFAYETKQFQHELSAIKEIGLIMGLSGSFYETDKTAASNTMTKQRFQNLSPDGSEPLPFYLTSHYQNAASFYDPIKQHGDLDGIHAGWEGHAFSFHLIKDGEKTHLIYVNRGQRDELAKEGDPAVYAFTFDDSSKKDLLLSELLKVLKTEKRSEISAFIHGPLMPYHNEQLSQTLRKSNQKVGNCTVANANIAWHFALAAREMKKDDCSFAQAYQKTKVAYKDMRMEDRAIAFCNLMTDSTIKVFRKDAAEQIMRKMYGKDIRTPGRETVRFLLNRLYEKDSNAVDTLFQDLCHSTYIMDGYVKLEWAKACANKLKEEGKYSDKALQDLIIKADFFKDVESESLKSYLSINPSDINFVAKENIPKYINDSLIPHLAIENVQYLLDTSFSSTKKSFVSKLSIKQATTLIQNKEISVEMLSDDQKENIEGIKIAPQVDKKRIPAVSDPVTKKSHRSKVHRKDLSDRQKENTQANAKFRGTINQEGFYKAMSDVLDGQIINKFNQSVSTGFLPMLSGFVCAFMIFDFILAVIGGLFGDWCKKTTAKDKQITQHLKEEQQGYKWDSLEQAEEIVEEPSLTDDYEKSIDNSERKALSQKIADNFRVPNSGESLSSAPGVFLSAEYMKPKDSLIQDPEFFDHGMILSIATTKDGKLDPEHLIFMDPNTGIFKIKNNLETIEKLMTCIEEELFSEFSVGSFNAIPISEECLEEKTPNHSRSYALSQAVLIDTYLNMQIMGLEKKQGGKGYEEKMNELLGYKEELEDYLKKYPNENPETREKDLMQFQQQLLVQINRASENRFRFGFAESQAQNDPNSHVMNERANEETKKPKPFDI